LGETEVIKDNLNPYFLKQFLLILSLKESDPSLKLDDDNNHKYDPLGEVRTRVSKIMDSRNQMLC